MRTKQNGKCRKQDTKAGQLALGQSWSPIISIISIMLCQEVLSVGSRKVRAWQR